MTQSFVDQQYVIELYVSKQEGDGATTGPGMYTYCVTIAFIQAWTSRNGARGRLWKIIQKLYDFDTSFPALKK